VHTIHRASERYQSTQPGIITRHSFAAGAHYDPDNVAFGALIGVDEHVVEPGAGFAAHTHRGVDIVSWVLNGTLRHEDDAGDVELVGPGILLRQRAGDGIRHTETNASGSAPLRFVQMTVLADAGAEFTAARIPGALEIPAAPRLHVQVLSGRPELAGEPLAPMDCVRAENEPLQLTGTATVALWRLR
jgi:redox-sensitive bicupin YhaK (pirin superfamily)